VNQTELQLRYF